MWHIYISSQPVKTCTQRCLTPSLSSLNCIPKYAIILFHRVPGHLCCVPFSKKVLTYLHVSYKVYSHNVLSHFTIYFGMYTRFAYTDLPHLFLSSSWLQSIGRMCHSLINESFLNGHLGCFNFLLKRVML